ncbi:MAG TPA: hypothetical protein IAD32_01705 [Candidatus Scatavimonas merdigallinarum]|uniref:Uncharacterized protein n=1 Tax=Candidatus Scatavimonas merdigallinarum TaxID=2840914 RepID=A0A9D1CUC7_9FIRM|nr:hypothetical protein [Candidatus Scatavimonas merdigallinarum]
MKKYTSCSFDSPYFYEMTSTHKSVCGKETRVYGIKLYKIGCDDSLNPAECFIATDVSADKAYVQRLLALFYANTVMPLHAPDILEECLCCYPALPF